MYNIILIAGLAGSGKDTLALMLEERLQGMKKTSFADPLKEILCKTLGISLEKLEYFKRKPEVRIGFRSSAESMCTSRNVRQMLQAFGTEAMKPVFGDDVWADLMIDKALSLGSENGIVIPDFRVPVEFDRLMAKLPVEHYRLITIKVVRDSIEAGDTHITENGLTNFAFDLVIENNGTLEDLSVQVDDLIETLDLPLKK